MKLSHRSSTVVPEIGFRAWRGEPKFMPLAHAHADVEWNWVTSGSARYFISGHEVTLEPGTLSIFWGGVPHRMMACAKNTQMAWLTLPLAAVLRWDLSTAFTDRLLHGEMLSVRCDEDSRRIDEILIRRWRNELNPAFTAQSRTVLLEIEARMRRHVADVLQRRRKTHRSEQPISAESASPLERMAALIGQRYQDDLRVADITAGTKMHCNAAMRLFKRNSGITIWEYLTRIRVAHAQRLLLTTEHSVTRIALDSGFGSLTRFYAAFARICRQTPRRYRAAMQQTELPIQS